MPKLPPAPFLPDLDGRESDPVAWMACQARHSRSFSFACRWLPDELVRPVAGIYTFCRLTDDLVDGPGPDDPEERRRSLVAWTEAARTAYDGGDSGHGLLQAVMSDAARHEVDFRHIRGLLDGVAVDLEPVTVANDPGLRAYTHGVAGTVGGWLTERVGVRDPDVLARAYELGHALQVTNVVRDVGEDLDRGRLYVPADLMAAHGVTRAELAAVRADPRRPLPDGWAEVLETLMSDADRAYDHALEAVPALPPAFGRAVVVAARVYQGIHDAVRKAGYDDLRYRAHTTATDRIRRAGVALASMARPGRIGAARGPSSRRTAPAAWRGR